MFYLCRPMQKEFSIQVPPETAGNSLALKHFLAKQSEIPFQEIRHVEILKRSIDARQKAVKFNLKVLVFVQEDFEEQPISPPDYGYVENAEEIVIIGAGPAGLFAALRCIELGKKPIVIERGKDVRARRRRLRSPRRCGPDRRVRGRGRAVRRVTAPDDPVTDARAVLPVVGGETVGQDLPVPLVQCEGAHCQSPCPV